MMIIGGIAVLALLVCGLSLLIVSQTNWWKEITGGRVVTVVAPSTKVAQESTATFTKTLKPTTQVPATPVPTTAVPTKRPPVIKSLRPIFTHTPTRTPTRVVGGPRIFGFEACARECNGVNAQQAFADPNGTSVIYYRYNYEKIPRGAHYVRSWSVEGKGEWIRYDCIWNGPEKGSFEANLQTSRKLFPGTWVLRIEVNGRPVLEEKIEVAGSSTYWMPVPTKDVCNQN